MEVTRALVPELYRYQSYRDFLKDFYEFKKSQRTGFSYRLFAKKARIKSPNYLQLVIQGKRNLSPKAAPLVAQAMGLKPKEAGYFLALVRKEAARSVEDRGSAEKSIRIAIRQLVSREIPRAQQEVLGTWYHLVVRELAFLKNFEPRGAWIAARLRGLITAEEAEESVKLLLRGGFLKQNPDGGFQVREPVIDTGDSFEQARIVKNHSDTLGAWRKILVELAPEDRELGLLNIPISSSRIPEFKRRIRAFQDEIIGWLQDEKAPDEVVQLGTYLMPISRAGGSG